MKRCSRMNPLWIQGNINRETLKIRNQRIFRKSLDEISMALKFMENNRAAADDDIITEAIKSTGQVLIERIHKLFNLSEME